ncbi:MAG TPA: hypothetical protein VLW83_17100, partial [Candidatus Acidoferrales bacterium]|nr:hypothetical protein [Candidatus Acidoferrales bacterium]
RFSVGLVGEFVIGAVALTGIGGAGTPSLSALHHPLQNCTFAEKVDLSEVASELGKTLRVSFQGGIPWRRADSAFGNRNA